MSPGDASPAGLTGGIQRAHRVPRAIRLAYGSGSIAEGTTQAAFNTFLLFYYNQVLGLPGSLAGAAILLALCCDAITDPLVGFLSDRHQSRLGRRHPFLYASGLPLALCLAALFRPPDGLGQLGLFAWLAVFSVGVRSALTLYQIPSNAMVPELTSDYDERTTLVTYRYMFGWIGGIGVSQLGYLYFFAPSERWADGRFDAAAYGAFGGVCALLAGGAVLACAVGTHRLIPRLRVPPEAVPTRFPTELREVLGNRSYRMLLAAALLVSVATGFSEVTNLYVNTYFWELSTRQISWLVYGLLISLALAAALARPLTARFDKRSVALALACGAVFLAPLPVVLRLLDGMPGNGSPLLLPILFVHHVLLVAAAVTIGIVTGSMLADLVDENDLVTGRRQEGMFASAISFTAKATSGLGGFLAGVALDLIAFPRGDLPGTVPEAQVFRLGLVVGPGLFTLYLATLFFLSRYELTRQRYAEILTALAARDEART